MLMRHSRASDGMTLAELLTVLMVVAVMTSIAVPMFWRMGMFTSDKSGESARELYAFLQAARVYAAANGVRTAVAYAVEGVDSNSPPSPLGTPAVPGFEGRHYVNTKAMVRQLSQEDVDRLSLDSRKLWFVPVQNPNGNFSPMLEGTCAYLEGAAVFEEEPFGLAQVYICDTYGQPLWSQGLFYAHVFKPSGEMLRVDNPDTSSTGSFTKQRFTVRVGLLEDETALDADFNPIPIDLFAATGRVKLAG